MGGGAVPPHPCQEDFGWWRGLDLCPPLILGDTAWGGWGGLPWMDGVRTWVPLILRPERGGWWPGADALVGVGEGTEPEEADPPA